MYSLFLYRKPDELDLFEKSCIQNTSKSDEYRRNCYKYSLQLSAFGGYISFPPEYGKQYMKFPTETYKIKIDLCRSVGIEFENRLWSGGGPQ